MGEQRPKCEINGSPLCSSLSPCFGLLSQVDVFAPNVGAYGRDADASAPKRSHAVESGHWLQQRHTVEVDGPGCAASVSPLVSLQTLRLASCALLCPSFPGPASHTSDTKPGIPGLFFCEDLAQCSLHRLYFSTLPTEHTHVIANRSRLMQYRMANGCSRLQSHHPMAEAGFEA